MDYCQQKATGAKHSEHIKFTNLLSQSDFSDSDLSLLSWLQSIPGDTFSCPFEQRSLNVDVERLKNPTLETSWTEHMLITPIKPNIFPHSAMPNTRPKGADIMTKSLNMSLIASGEYLSGKFPGRKTGNWGPEISCRKKDNFPRYFLVFIKIGQKSAKMDQNQTNWARYLYSILEWFF